MNAPPILFLFLAKREPSRGASLAPAGQFTFRAALGPREKTLWRVGPHACGPPASGEGTLAVPRGGQGRKRVALGGILRPGEVPDTVCFLFPLPLPCRFANPYLPPKKAQANLVGQTFRQSLRGLHQTHNRGARPAQLSSPARAGRRPPNLCWHIFRNLSYISKPARRCRFCARRPFLLDRARPVFFSARSKRKWGRIVASNLAFPYARTGTLPRPTPPKGANLWAFLTS